MEVDQRLSDRMRNNINRFGQDDQKWNQFVKDHKDYIRAKSTLKDYLPEYLSKFRYRPEEFYADNSGLNTAAWIWQYINDLRDVTDFTEARTQYYMFSWDVIESLYSVYEGSAEYSGRE